MTHLVNSLTLKNNNLNAVLAESTSHGNTN